MIRPSAAKTELVPLPAAPLGPRAPWPRVLSAFLQTHDSPETRRAYRREVELAFSVLREEMHELTGERLVNYRRQVIDESGWAPGTIARHLAVLRSFLLWAGVVGTHQLSGEIVRMVLKGYRAVVEKPYQVVTEA